MDHFKRGGFASPELETTNNGYLAVDLFLALSGYATAMLMAGMRPAFCAILKAYSKRIDGRAKRNRDVEAGKSAFLPGTSPEQVEVILSA
jgi:hypothetical protein